MSASTGIGPLDDRIGGLDEDGLYLLSAAPVPARTAAVLQFLEAGLEAGDRVGLVTRARVDGLFESAARFGCSLEDAWHDGRLRLVGFRGDHEVRLRRAADPGEVYAELESLLDPLPERLAVDPGTVLWEGRGDGSAASAFVDFVDRATSLTLATTTVDLTGELPLSTEFAAQAAAGIFQLHERGGGLLCLSIDKLEGGRPDRAEVTLALREGEGLTDPDEMPARRSTDRGAGDANELLWLAMGGGLSEELEQWIGEAYRVTRAEDPLDLVSRLQDDGYGIVLVSLGRDRLGDGLKSCRVCRRLQPGVPVVVVSEEPFRASDRSDLLRAGAGECMTGGLNVEELASGLELAGARTPARAGAGEAVEGAGGSPWAGAAPGTGDREAPAVDDRPGEPLDEDAFRDELRERLSEPDPRVFTVVRFAADDPEGLAGRLSELVRTGEGEFAGVLGGASAVWLSGTVPAEADGFVRRVRDTLPEDEGGSGEAEILGSARDAERLHDLVG